MRTLKAELGRFNRKEERFQKLNRGRNRRIESLERRLRILILQKIYEEAAGKFPHDFDPVVILRKLRADGYPIIDELFFTTFEKFDRLDEKIETRGGSSNITHYSCLGKVSLG